jgi:hypothetical protein
LTLNLIAGPVSLEIELLAIRRGGYSPSGRTLVAST